MRSFRLRRLFAYFLLTSMLMLTGFTLSASAQSSASLATLQKMEMHFYDHDFAKDDTESRVDRIEKMVFGEAKEGDFDKRIADLDGLVDKPQSAESIASQAASGNFPQKVATTNSSGSGSSAGSSADSTIDDSGVSYPKVNELEELILGQEYPRLKLKLRLAQLETKIFGKPSPSDDLSQRTEQLENYWQNSLNPNMLKQYQSSITYLEQQAIGQTYPNKPLIERVQTLEGIIFPNDHTNYKTPIQNQISTMLNAVHLSTGQQSNVIPLNNTADSGTAANYGYGTAPGQATTLASAGNYGTVAPGAYRGNATYQHTGYPGTTADSANQYTSQGQYASAPATNPNYNPYHQASGTIQPFANSAATASAPPQKSQGHPLLKGLAKALGAAAGMAAGAMMNSSMYGGYGGYGGYGMSPMGYNPYNYGGIPGYGGASVF